MPRVISGLYRGRRLASPPDAATSRPYPDRIKESVCNLLRGWFEDAVVVDFFAGVGTMSLEMASRGARSVTAVERDRRVLDLLRANMTELGVGDEVKVIAGDALAPATVLRCPESIDLAFLDPPYAMMQEEPTRKRVLDQAARLGARLPSSGFLILRTPIDPARTPHPIEGLDGPEIHRYAKDMFVCLYAPPAGEDDADTDADEVAGDDDGAGGGDDD